MRDFPTFRQSALRYWERRRLIYNLALVLPSMFGFLLADNFNWVGDPHATHYVFIALWFASSAIAANVCYTLAYAIEFLFGNDDPSSRWMRFGRATAFVCGTLFSILLALLGGINIANLHWSYGTHAR